MVERAELGERSCAARRVPLCQRHKLRMAHERPFAGAHRARRAGEIGGPGVVLARVSIQNRMRTGSTTQAALAIDGGTPVRATLLPYGKQSISEDDIHAVVDVLRSDWLTTGPKVSEFEEAVATSVGAKYAVAFSSGTAALHGAAFAAGLKSGDEAITSPLTFAATANCVLYQGATPVFADVSPDTLNLDPEKFEQRVTPSTRAVIPVDYAGHPSDLEAMLHLAKHRGWVVVEDACHALGAEVRRRRCGSIAD